MKRCVNCGKALPEGSRSDRRTCGPACRMEMSRRLAKRGTCPRCGKDLTAPGIVSHEHRQPGQRNYADGKVLIAGVLYDSETLTEAE